VKESTVLVFSGERLCALLDQSPYSDEQFAVLIGKSFHLVRKLKRDEVRPSISTYGKIVSVLGCAADDLLVEADEPDARDSDLGRATDAWIKRTLATAPELTEAQARRVSAALFGATR
jgi:transcriptional regulator with XRE-family HTH domain